MLAHKRNGKNEAFSDWCGENKNRNPEKIFRNKIERGRRCLSIYLLVLRRGSCYFSVFEGGDYSGARESETFNFLLEGLQKSYAVLSEIVMG